MSEGGVGWGWKVCALAEYWNDVGESSCGGVGFPVYADSELVHCGHPCGADGIISSASSPRPGKG